VWSWVWVRASPVGCEKSAPPRPLAEGRLRIRQPDLRSWAGASRSATPPLSLVALGNPHPRLQSAKRLPTSRRFPTSNPDRGPSTTTRNLRPLRSGTLRFLGRPGKRHRGKLHREAKPTAKLLRVSRAHRPATRISRVRPTNAPRRNRSRTNRSSRRLGSSTNAPASSEAQAGNGARQDRCYRAHREAPAEPGSRCRDVRQDTLRTSRAPSPKVRSPS
jgi:hypothetical protein